MYKSILVPLDGSQNATKALDIAILYSKAFNSKVSILSVANNMSYGYEPMPAILYESFDNRAKKIVEVGKEYASERGVNVETFVKRGNPKQAIMEFAHNKGIDLIIIGKSGTNAFDRLVIGSTTADVVRNSDVHVLVVNA